MEFERCARKIEGYFSILNFVALMIFFFYIIQIFIVTAALYI